MATDADVTMTNKRGVVGKRRLSRDTALPDVTNFPDMLVEKRETRQRSLAVRTASLTFASGQENEDSGTQTSALTNSGSNMQPPQGHPQRAAKIAAKAKMKAVITPWGHSRRRKQTTKTPSPPITVSPPLPLPSPCEEPMEIDNPALAIRAFEHHVPETVHDIDDNDDYFLSPEYAKDIVAYMKSQEGQVVLPADYLAINPDITSQMRGILMDWLIQVQAHEQLEEETIQLCVTLTDLYLARALVPLAQLQLVGITCLLVSAKFVERFPPLVNTLRALTAGTYTDIEVLEMEKQVLCVLHFTVNLPLPYFFLKRFLMVHPNDIQVERLAHYLVDLSLPSVRFVSVLPSVLAASALCVARCVWLPEEPEPWGRALVFYTGYTFSELSPIVVMLAKILLRAPVSKYQGARKKHSAEDPYGAISMDPVLDNHPALLELCKDSQ